MHCVRVQSEVYFGLKGDTTMMYIMVFKCHGIFTVHQDYFQEH